VSNALVSQSAPLVLGSTTLYNYVQNVPRTRARGVELVIEQDDVLFDGLSLSGSVTYADGRTLVDPILPTAVGKRTPQLPPWRATAAATYRPDDAWTITLAARYSDRAFGTIDNSDIVANTFQGFASYLVVDTRVQYRIDEHWSASAGVDNLNNDRYFLFHPFPQRTYLLELRYAD
jgi:iron complex outermembrane receptor protein